MTSFILKTSSRYLFPILIVGSLVVLYRGHHLPGGGFIGGLIAATAYALIALGAGFDEAKRKLRVEPDWLLVAGLSSALISALIAVFMGQEFFTAKWLPEFHIPLLGGVHLGTPFLFDIGVYLTVVGFSLKTVFTFASIK